MRRSRERFFGAALRRLPSLAAVVAGVCPALPAQPEPAPPAPTVLTPAALGAAHAALAARIDAAPALRLADGGLCGVRCGANVRLAGKAEAVVQLPLPQLLAGQVPVAFAFVAEPATALRQLTLVPDAAGGQALQATVQGKNGDEVRLSWSAVVLLADRPEPAAAAVAKDYLTATPCAQADHPDVAAVAKELAPADATPAQLAAALQQWIARQPRKQRPTSLDALSLQKHGNHGICTVNANFAAAVLRQRGIPTQSLAVVPTNGMRLEMHRVVAWSADDRWQRFDPSGVSATVPMRAGDCVVVARTAIADERRAGQPRMAAPVGCPWGQELEVVRGPAAPYGTDFFWTVAKPLAAFAVDEAALAAATAAWRTFATKGVLAPAAGAAAKATDAAGFAAAWRP